jgi:hypothetical protein
VQPKRVGYANLFGKSLICKVNSLFSKAIFSRQIFLFQNTKEKFGGKKLFCKRVNLLCKGTRSIYLESLVGWMDFRVDFLVEKRGEYFKDT